jgi:hypothetical protein
MSEQEHTINADESLKVDPVHLSAVLGGTQSFEEWKKDTVKYLSDLVLLHIETKAEPEPTWLWILGDDEEMKRDGYDYGMTPSEYVDYQIECAA